MKFNSATHIRLPACLRGFTFIELMIAIAVISLLSMVAYPSFLDSIRKSRRTDALTALTVASNNLERFFSTNNTYTTDVTQLGLDIDGGVAYSSNGHYSISVAAGATGIGSSYVITAAAVAGNSQADDTGCETLTINSLGQRTPNPGMSRCW